MDNGHRLTGWFSRGYRTPPSQGNGSRKGLFSLPPFAAAFRSSHPTGRWLPSISTASVNFSFHSPAGDSYSHDQGQSQTEGRNEYNDLLNGPSSTWPNYTMSELTSSMLVVVPSSPPFPDPQVTVPATVDIPASKYLPSAQQGDCFSFTSSALRTPPGDVQLEKGDVLSYPVHPCYQPELSPLETDHSLTTDPSTLVNLAGLSRPFLPPGYRWFEEGDLKVIGTRPIDAGGFANVWVGETGGRKVAIKSYRCYASAEYMPTYKVNFPPPLFMSYLPTTNR